MSEIPDKPGIYYDVPDADYCAWPYASKSTLAKFRDESTCEAEIRYALDHPAAQTDDMRMGTLLEAAVDGMDIEGNVKPLPPEIKARRGAAWDILRQENPEITYLPTQEYAKHKEDIDVIRAMAASVCGDPIAGKLLAKSKRQVSFVWDAKFVGMSGVEVTHRLKGRLDYLSLEYNTVADLKWTMMGGQRAVGRLAYSKGYDIQAALYTDAMRELLGKPDLGFHFIFCRGVRPYIVTVYNGHSTQNMDGEYLDLGRRSYQVYAEQLADCRKTGNWRGFRDPSAPDQKILSMYLPPWAT